MRSLLLVSLILLAAGAGADSLTEQLERCAGIKKDSERLACYDALGGTLGQWAEQDFGREQQRISKEAPESITATITDVESGAYDKLLITLDNGQVWRQTDSNHANWKSGEAVVLERGLFGSFFMKKAGGGRSIRVKRQK